MKFEIGDVVYDPTKNKLGVVIATKWLWIGGVVVQWEEYEGVFFPHRAAPEKFVKIGEL